MEDALYRGCDDLGAPGNDSTFGWGRANLNLTVRAALEGNMVLIVPTLTGGSNATFYVNAGPPNTTIFLAYSLAGEGLYDIPALNAVLGIASPVEAAHGASNGIGRVNFTRNIPSGGSGLTVWFQAVAQGATSNIEMTTIL